MVDKIHKPDTEWQEQLTTEQYLVLRRHATEPPHTGQYEKTSTPGTYVCAGCGNPLFRSDDKFESGTGWPSFTRPLDEERVEMQEDLSAGSARTEVHCSRCNGHLGHVFPDGPQPTGQRYCINSASLELEPQQGQGKA